ncbi:hypothetical protein GSI_10277 [Ganoderma sinense ZZ0214-1]|uniref:Uncharacterized protein n=1 Tax=Ganoderma sinense ZZ0214-1 TaxID=1077348 RepID=A0A2G8S043_9APHY|nr:hypothetical protein GSI_10277 [Ganoderma sinense ZZ0214-1]
MPDPPPPPPPPPHAQAEQPSTARAPNLNTEKLRGLVEAVEQLKAEVQRNKDAMEQKEAVLYAEIRVLKAQVAQGNARFKELRMILGIGDEADEGEEGEGEGGADNVEETAATTEQIQRSAEAAKGKMLKMVLNEAFKKRLGVSALRRNALPSYPEGVSTDDEDWPRDPQTNKRLTRFKWDEPPDSKVNAAGLKKVCRWIRTHGAAWNPRAAQDIEDILPVDLEKRVRERWQYLAKQMRKRSVEGAGNQADDSSHDEDEENDEEGDVENDGNVPEGRLLKKPAKGKGRSAAVLRSRAKAKCDQRIRKRKGTKYDDPKYDAAFIVNAMSDDEDDPGSYVNNKATRYVSHAPHYRSLEAQELYDFIDAQPDPDPRSERSMLPRIRGAADPNATPTAARELGTRIRAWQVNPSVLTDHPEWFRFKMVATSGVAWGDEKDPEEDKKPVSASAAAAGGKRRKIPRVDDASDVAEAQKQLERVTGGKDVAELFEIDQE